ncbi:hypothetical protein U1Q18_016010 [Sarracenia purpurea var. burkii]
MEKTSSNVVGEPETHGEAPRPDKTDNATRDARQRRSRRRPHGRDRYREGTTVAKGLDVQSGDEDTQP